MESFSRILPMSRAKFPEPLRSQLIFSPPLVIDEDCSASYIIRTSHSYTHNPTRAAIVITPSKRLVLWAMGAKKIDLPLEDPRWLGGVTITADKEDRVSFMVRMGVYGTGTMGDSLEIKVKTKQASKVAEIAQAAMARAGQVQPASNTGLGQQVAAPTPLSAPGAPYHQSQYMQNQYSQYTQPQEALPPVEMPVSNRPSIARKPVGGQGY